MKKFVVKNFIFAIIIYNVECFSRTNFYITEVQLCDSLNEIKFNGTVLGEMNRQYLNGDLSLPFELDEQYGAQVRIEDAADNKTYLPVFQVYEKNACKSMHRYLRQFIYDLERVAGITPNVCPIRAGRYHVNNYLLNFHTIGLQTFPFGKLKFSLKILNNRRPTEILFCGFCEVMNVYN